MRRAKTRAEIATEFFVTKTEIQKLFGLSRSGASKVFEMAVDDTSTSLFDGTKVRLAKACSVMHISQDELRRKVLSD